MSGAYQVSGEVAVADPNTLLSTSTGTTRYKLYDWMIGSKSTAPADVAILWTVARSTVTGTGGIVRVATALDPADGTTIVTANEAPTTEPTYTGNSELIEVGVNERATFRWVAAPGGELIVAATASTGLGLHATHASDTDLMFGTMHWME